MTQARADFLERIASGRRRQVEEMKARVPGHVLRSRLDSPPPAGRLERALRRGDAGQPIRLLCEVKRASPSKGLLQDGVDPVAMAQLYERGGAAAISLVTEPAYFLGDPEWVNRVRPAVSIPLLMKDFVVDSYQLYDAATRGADAVLLLAALLSEGDTQRLISEARMIGLDCLVEVHDLDELTRSLRAGATLVGINNRNLRTFEVDLDTSRRLLPLVPAHATAVAESGLSTPRDLEGLRGTRCDAVLMGEVFMTSSDPSATLVALATAARGKG